MLDEYKKLIAIGRVRKAKKGLHRHRIVPGYKGGKYNSENVIYLTRKEHIRIHRLRWLLFANRRDLLACRLLGERLTDDEWILCAKVGGFISGRAHAENRTGVCGRSKLKMSTDGKKAIKSMSIETRIRAGKITGNWTKTNRKGIFGISPIQARINCAKGGHIAGTKLSQWDRTKGVVKTRWITNGEHHLRLKSTDIMPEGFRLGRLTPWQTPSV